MNPRMEVLREEFIAKRAILDGFDRIAADEKRDLTDEERADYDFAVTRMEAISKDIQETNARQERFDAVAAVTQRVSPAYTKDRSPVEVLPSFGEQVKIRALHALGKGGDEYETLTRALVHGVSSDGTAPVTIEGDLIKFVDAQRYAVNAVKRLPMPDNHAPSFRRPRATQFTSVDKQVNEGDVLASQKFTVTADTINKTTYGGVVSLSEQEIDWTEPSMLGLIVQDLAQQYAIKTDTVVCTAIANYGNGATPTNYTINSLTANTATLMTSLATASAGVYSASKNLADTLFIAPDRWAYLAALTDGNGRPIFPVSSTSFNAPGAGGGVTQFTPFSIMGLQIVVDPNFASGTMIVANTSLVEVYEQDKGLLQIAAPSTLETIIAYRGYFATNVYTQGLWALHP